jgi:hypothetical protein
MRPLTQQEIDDAPEWATHYTAEDEHVTFISEKYYQNYHVPLGRLLIKRPRIGLSGYEQPIPRKEFDIIEYLESDSTHEAQQPYIADEGRGDLNINGEISKFHAIGIGKHFKLTSDDLK